MSLCYDFQKHMIITFTAIATVLLIGLVSIAYGQTIEDQQKQNCESIQGTWTYGKCVVDKNSLELKQQSDNSMQDELDYSLRVLQNKQETFESMLNYCFQHADRPNPLQDLIDKGLMPINMTGITCKDVKQMSDSNQNQIGNLQNKINEIQRIESEYNQCIEQREVFYNTTETYQECKLVLDQSLKELNK